MWIKNRQPFYHASEDGDGGETQPASQGTVLPEQAPTTTHAVPASERTLDPPTTWGQRTKLEGFEDAVQGDQESVLPADQQESVQQTKYFSEGFDPGTLPDALQSEYKQMRDQFDSMSAHIPTADQLDSLAVRAQAFDRVAGSEEWKRFLDQNYSNGESRASSQEQDLQEQAAMDSLDPDQKTLIQRMIDKAVDEKVTPVHEQFFADKAQTSLDMAKKEFGEDVWKSHEKEILSVMTRDKIDARKAFLMIQGERLLGEQKAIAAKTIQAKVNASAAPQSANHTVAPAANSSRKIQTIAEAVHLAEEMYMNGDSRYDPASYRLKAGQG